MESESEKQALQNVAAIRAQTARAPRGHALLQLAYSVLLSAYMGIVVFTGSMDGGASAFGGTTMTLILPPIIVSSALVNGANERFGERMRVNARYWIAFGVFALMLVLFMSWGIIGNGYPWWMALVTVAITLVLFGARPLSVILSSSSQSQPDNASPSPALSLPARLTTAFLGIFLGLMCAVVLVPAAAWLVLMLGLIVVLIAATARAASWGLLSTGHEWRLPQWAAFGIAAVVMFLLAVLIIVGGIVTPVLAVGAGVIVAVVLIVSVFVPGSRRGASAA